MPAWTSLAAELEVNERTLRRGYATGWIRVNRSRYRDWFIGADESEYLIRHWDLLAALRESLRNDRRSRLAVLAGPAARRDYDGAAVPVVLASLVRRAGTHIVLGHRLTMAVGRRVDVIPLDDRTEVRHGELLLGARLFSRVLRDPDNEWRRWKERTRALGADGVPRASALQLPEEYVLDEEHFSEHELARAVRSEAGERDSLRFIDPF